MGAAGADLPCPSPAPPLHLHCPPSPALLCSGSGWWRGGNCGCFPSRDGLPLQAPLRLPLAPRLHAGGLTEQYFFRESIIKVVAVSYKLAANSIDMWPYEFYVQK